MGSVTINGSLLIAAGATYFWLDPKVGKRSRKKNASPLKANAWPAFLSGHRSFDCPNVYFFDFLSCFVALDSYFSFLLQTASAKRGQNNDGLREGRGIGDFAEGWACERKWAKDPVPIAIGMCVLDAVRHGPCVKKPFANRRFGYFGAPK
ncbi:hypothetical protein [Mucilaginibacter jinjuensis]|uniref:Uncharacterized protein n=1 Tax=Mucilaginibacter jinjuensis TaxID=1176721 RepID=A0ABY7T8T1_9SPHI|nr:hypothetical protein [Mucilaginibacter jinjuensis]WCT11617.1 hypothetical protein PQO05_23055 [Mucilaginibacter jinjuensis]